MQELSHNLYYHVDTCHTYILKHANQAVLIDFGNGSVLDELKSIGVDTVVAILMTHHHRDQAQGLACAVAQNIPIYVPHMEQHLFHSVGAHWQARTVMNNYDMRQDRFSLLESVPVKDTLRDYADYHFANYDFTIIPTPGHTQGSISLQTSVDGQEVIFTGDLIAGQGKIWSLSATQWSYNGAEGVAASIPSLSLIKEQAPNMLLPSHGEIIKNPDEAIDATIDRLWHLLQLRGTNSRLFQFMESAYREITPHLLFNQTSMSNAYVVLSESGKALLIDFGYDFITGISAGSDRSSRRPWLFTLKQLKEHYGVNKIDVVIPTHFHDDHVAGLNLLRDIEGVEVWAAENFSHILENPYSYDLPCLWYDPIPVDRQLPLNTAITWEEYEFTLYELSGHTHYAVGIFFEIDGKRVLASGDQYQGVDGLEYNYVYKNDYHIGDYIHSAELYRQLKPDIIITGHWEPMFVTPDYFDIIEERGNALTHIHRDLLPLETVDLTSQGFIARITPYQSFVKAGEQITITVEVHNPFPEPYNAVLILILPDNWQSEISQQTIQLNDKSSCTFTFIPSPNITRRARIAIDVTVGHQTFGQQAEALVTVYSSEIPSDGIYSKD